MWDPNHLPISSLLASCVCIGIWGNCLLLSLPNPGQKPDYLAHMQLCCGDSSSSHTSELRATRTLTLVGKVMIWPDLCLWACCSVYLPFKKREESKYLIFLSGSEHRDLLVLNRELCNVRKTVCTKQSSWQHSELVFNSLSKWLQSELQGHKSNPKISNNSLQLHILTPSRFYSCLQ